MAFSTAKSGFTQSDLAQMGPSELERKRKIAEALIAAGSGIQDIRSPLQGFAQLANALVGNIKEARIDRAEREGKSGANALFSAGMGMGEFPSAPGGGGASGNASAAPSGKGMRGDEIAWKDASPEQRAFLNTLAGPESGGRYDVIYGGGKFNDFSRHPNRAVNIQTGPNAGRTSSAAGKYQFLGSTWDDQAKKLGLTDFSPESQDKGAWNLAAETFKAKTGQDLLSVLKSGDPKAIAAVGPMLRDVWTSLPGGIEQGTNQDKFVSTYQRMLAQGASPAQAQQAATQETGAVAPNAPVQVASLDPKAGVESAMREQGQDPNDPLSQALIRLKRANPDATPPGVTTDPSGVQIAETPEAADLLSQQQMQAQAGAGAGAVPASGGGIVPPSAPNAQAAPPARLAQALIGGQDPAMTLGAPAITPDGPSMGTLMNMAGNEFMTPQQQRMIEALTGKRMEQADPEHQLDLEYKRAQLKKLQGADVSEFQQRAQAAQQFGLDPNSSEGRNFILTGQMPNAKDKFGNSLIWGKDRDGKWVVMQPNSGGGIEQAQAPEGVELVPPGVSNLDLGTEYGIRDRSGNVIKTVPKNVAGEASEKKQGELQGAAAFDLPRVQQNAEQTLGVLERMRNHPGRAGSTGFIEGMLPSRTSAQVDFQSLVDQTQGQSFLQAFQMLKGGGQITEVEGQKATDAISRLRNQRLGDEDYVKAIDDLESVIRNGLARAQQQATKGGNAAAPAAAQANPSATASPQTEEEYNALPSGSLFIDPDDGKTYRKP